MQYFKTKWSRFFAILAVFWLLVICFFAFLEYREHFKVWGGDPMGMRRGVYKTCEIYSSPDKYVNWVYWGAYYSTETKDENRSKRFYQKIAYLRNYGLSDAELYNKYNVNIGELSSNPKAYRDRLSLPRTDVVWNFNVMANILKLDDNEFSYSESVYDAACTGSNEEVTWSRSLGMNGHHYFAKIGWFTEFIEEIFSVFAALYFGPLIVILAAFTWVFRGSSGKIKHSDQKAAENSATPYKDEARQLVGELGSTDNKGETIVSTQGSHNSVADELLKWAKLKEDGHISEEEFKEARDKLLKKH